MSLIIIIYESYIQVPLGEEASVRKVAEELHAKGVEVELKYESKPTLNMNNNAALAMQQDELSGTSNDNKNTDGELKDENGNIIHPSLDSLDSLTVFELFMKSNNFKEFLSKTDPKSVDKLSNGNFENASFFKRVYEEGKNLLVKLSNLETSTHGDIKTGNTGDNFHDIKFGSVSLSNFGPYGGVEPVIYPISDRGLVLIRGASTDKSGADSNGSGKTTLAMSVLWGLTGSMDARLVADGKLTEVAFEDSSSGGSAELKSAVAGQIIGGGGLNGIGSDTLGSTSGTNQRRTAEVKLQGFVNGKPFTVTRRRGKKSELYFEYDFKDCSMQAVKDTQDLINRTFGIESGKLQRSCFFGQHSHTMQSLLGLSDSRFKSELSLLVNNTALFVAAANSVKVKDRADKQSLNNIGVERNIRAQELSKIFAGKAQIDENIQALNLQIEKEKRDFIEDLNKKNQNSDIAIDTIDSRESSLSFTNVDILLQDLEKIQLQINDLQNNNLEKLRLELESVSKNRLLAVKSIDDEISKQKEKSGIGNNMLSAYQTSMNNLSSKIKSLDVQLKAIESQMQTLVPSLRKSSHQTSDLYDFAINIDSVRNEYNEVLSKRSNIESQRNAFKSALTKLNSALKLDNNNYTNDNNGSNSGARTAPDKKIICHDSTSADDSCPTCGQELSFDKLKARFADLSKQLSAIEPDYLSINNSVSDLKKMLDSSMSWIQLQDRRSNMLGNRKEINAELEKINSSIPATKADLMKLESSLLDLRSRKTAVESDYLRLEKDTKGKIQHFQTEIMKLHKDDQNLRNSIEQSRKMEKLLSSSKSDFKNKIDILEERRNALFRSLKEKMDGITEIEKISKKLDEDSASYHESIAVSGMLSLLFGPRGIQHFIYLDIILMLQKITNSYLNILSQGGLQISLQSLQADDTPQAKPPTSKKKEKIKSADGSKNSSDHALTSTTSSDASFDGISSSSRSSSSGLNSTIEDRIIKTVYIRNSSNNYSERSLSQLSGGQYRRVSLALDLAFTECLRRKGLLRSNLLVMDESLTHLDARGREGVGQLLRALVRKTASSSLSSSDITANNDNLLLATSSTSKFSKPPKSSSSINRNIKVSLNSDSINNIEYLDMNDTNVSSTDSDDFHSKNNKKKEKFDDEMATCMPYETIIVILQDLIATELEEAFDHIDIVKKESDISTVLVDDH